MTSSSSDFKHYISCPRVLQECELHAQGNIVLMCTYQTKTSTVTQTAGTSILTLSSKSRERRSFMICMHRSPTILRVVNSWRLQMAKCIIKLRQEMNTELLMGKLGKCTKMKRADNFKIYLDLKEASGLEADGSGSWPCPMVGLDIRPCWIFWLVFTSQWERMEKSEYLN